MEPPTKRGPGRPTEERRDTGIHLRLSPTEARRLEQEAQRRGTDRASTLRLGLTRLEQDPA